MASLGLRGLALVALSHKLNYLHNLANCFGYRVVLVQLLSSTIENLLQIAAAYRRTGRIPLLETILIFDLIRLSPGFSQAWAGSLQEVNWSPSWLFLEISAPNSRLSVLIQMTLPSLHRFRQESRLQHVFWGVCWDCICRGKFFCKCDTWNFGDYPTLKGWEDRTFNKLPSLHELAYVASNLTLC